MNARRTHRIRMALLMVVSTLGACEHAAFEPPVPEEVRMPAGDPALDVLTWNVYVGAAIEGVLAAEDPSQVPVLVAEAWQAVQATDFPERAAAIADQVARLRPHAVGLQEVSVFRLQPDGDALGPAPTPATDVVLDYLALLTDALAERGVAYRVGAVSENFDIEVPMLTGFEDGVPLLADIRITDLDVILVRADLPYRNARTHRFAHNLVVELGGASIEVARGFAAVDIDVNGATYRFVTTHLEPADPGGVVNPDLEALQLAQAAELLDLLGAAERIVLTGDLNSAAEGPGSRASYDLVLANGFVDAWTVGRPRGEGFTSNQAADLRNEVSELFHRIDFVLYRDARTADGGRLTGAVHAERVGEEPADRTPGGLWPSDHAGVAATLRIAPGAP